MEPNLALLKDILESKGYHLGQKIGEGGFSKCFVVKSTMNDCELVCKVINVQEDPTERGYLQTYKAEINILTQILHPNVIKIYNHFIEQQYLFIILEMCKGGSLQEIIKKNGKLKGQKLLKTTHEIVSGIDALHAQKIAHHDIKPANILFDSYERAKLADFGFAAVELEPKIKRFAGSIFYMAPEILKKIPYDPFKADIWAFGVTLFQMATGDCPFKGNCVVDLLTDIQLGYNKTELESIPQVIAKIIRGCLHQNPNQRLTTSQILMLLDSAYSASHLIPTPPHIPAQPFFGHFGSSGQNNLSLRPGNLRLCQSRCTLDLKPKIVQPTSKPRLSLRYGSLPQLSQSQYPLVR